MLTILTHIEWISNNTEPSIGIMTHNIIDETILVFKEKTKNVSETVANMSAIQKWKFMKVKEIALAAVSGDHFTREG